MSYVYIVVATRDAEIEACETFSGVQSALGRAFQLASDKSGRGRTDLFHHSPDEETLPDGSIRWVFMNTNKQSVIVCYRKIEDALLDSRNPNNLIGGLSSSKNISKDLVPVCGALHGSWVSAGESIHNVVSVKSQIPTWPARGTLDGTPIHETPKLNEPPPPFDIMDRTLPAGWNVDEKPILMGEFLDNPDNVKDPLFELTENQKWALVKARIRKSPNYTVYPKGYSSYVTSHNDSLKAIEERNTLGISIRDADIKRLSVLLSELLDA